MIAYKQYSLRPKSEVALLFQRINIEVETNYYFIGFLSNHRQQYHPKGLIESIYFTYSYYEQCHLGLLGDLRMRNLN